MKDTNNAEKRSYFSEQIPKYAKYLFSKLPTASGTPKILHLGLHY